MEISKIKLGLNEYGIKDEVARQQIIATYKDCGSVEEGFLYDVLQGNYQKINCLSDLSVVIVGESIIGTIVTLQIQNENNYCVIYGDRIIVHASGNYVIRFIKTQTDWQIIGVVNKDLGQEFISNQRFEELSKTVSDNKNKLNNLNVPTKTSEIVNDSGYVTSEDVPTKTSELQNDSNFVTASNVPTKVSDLENDSGYVTSSYIPTNVSDLTNDAGYITSGDVPKRLSEFTNDVGYLTTEREPLYLADKPKIALKSEIPTVPTKVSDLTNDRGYITSESDPIYLKDKPNIALKSEIPTKTSDLTNDSDFVTSSDIPTIPTKTSDLTNDSDFVTSSDIPTIPTKTSDLTNDSGYITSESDPIYLEDKPNIALKSEIPTKVSHLENDSNFVTSSDIPKNTSELTNDSGYITLDDLSSYNEVTSIQFADYTHFKCTVPQTNIQLNLTQITDTVCVFTTGDTVEYTVSFVDGMNVNKPFEFEPNKTYIVAIDHYLVVWNEVVEGE